MYGGRQNIKHTLHKTQNHLKVQPHNLTFGSIIASLTQVTKAE